MMKEPRRHPKDRRWFTLKRRFGIIGHQFPCHYRRSKSYPRYFGQGLNEILPQKEEPRRTKTGRISKAKLKPLKSNFLGVKTEYKNACFDDFSHTLEKKTGFRLFELDMASCHTVLYSSLGLGTPLVDKCLQEGKSIWSTIICELDQEVVDPLTAATNHVHKGFVKACLKRICYKCLQGGRVDTAEKIHKTLSGEETFLLGEIQPKDDSKMDPDETLIRDPDLEKMKALFE
jgi:hypothetical protein